MNIVKKTVFEMEMTDKKFRISNIIERNVELLLFNQEFSVLFWSFFNNGM